MPRYGPEILGGAEGLVRQQAHALVARGWDVLVWATTADDDTTWSGSLPLHDRDDAVVVRRFPVARRRDPWRFHQASRLMFRLPAPLRPEQAWIRAQGPFAPALIADLERDRGVPSVFTPYLYYTTIAGITAARGPKLLMPAAHDERPLRLRAIARAVDASDAIWYQTPEERDLVERTHPAASKKPHAVGTAGIDPHPPADAGRFRHRFGVRGPFLLFAGRAATGKGREELLERFRALRELRGDVELVMTGHDDPASVVAGARQLGRVETQTLRDGIAGAAAVVVPGALESLSMLALEAWANGRPVIANAGSAVLRGQARRSGGALLFSDTQTFVDAALRLIDDVQLGERLGRAGREYVLEHYRWDDVASRLEGLVERAHEQSKSH